MEEKVKCPLCEGQARAMPWKVESRWPLCECLSCGLKFLHPAPTDNELKDLYESAYFRSWGVTDGKEPEFLRRMKKATFQRQIDMLRNYLASGKVLDAGCATGLFMEVAQQNGYTPSGLDISTFAVDIARKKFGADAVFHGEIEWLAQQPIRFDAITMSDYIEHVRSPLRTFQAAWTLLQPGGILLAQTPDTSSFSAKLMGRSWTHLKMEHLFYFHPKSIEELGKRSGFRLLEIRRAKKALNPAYIRHQFREYRHPLLTPVSAAMHGMIPSPWRSSNLMLKAGELIAVFRKEA